MTRHEKIYPAADLASSPLAGSAATPAKMPCLNCNGSGETEVMGLTDDRFHWRECWDCGGTGEVEPYCLTCESKLTADLFCYQCDDYGVAMNLVPPLPEGWVRVAY